MAGWRRLRLTLGVVEDDGEANEEKGETQREERAETGREVEKQVEKYREKGKKKGVTWADDAKGGCLEKTRVVSVEGPPPLLVVPGRHRKMCGEMVGCEVGDKETVKVECAGLDGDEDVDMGDVKDVDDASGEVMRSNASEDPLNDLPPSFSPPPSTSPPPYSSASSSPSSPTPSPVEDEDETSHHSTIREGHDLDLRTDTDVRIPGWDSDLSNLSESDSSASETDSTTDSDSADESDSDTTSTSTIPVTVRLPSPLSSFFSPTSSFCSNHPNQPKRASKSAFVYPLRDPPRLSDFVRRRIVVRFWRLEIGMSTSGRCVCCAGRGSGRGGG